MVKFLLGFATAVVVVLLGLFCFVRFGFVDPRADAAEGAIERKVAMPALDAAVDRRAPEVQNPVQPTDDNLMAGMKIYQTACAGCHGDIQQTHTKFGDSFYPRVPQFAEDAPDMPENQNFFIIEHGVRLSGMPGWKGELTESQMWQVTTFLSHMDKLPAGVSAAWKLAAGAPPGTENAPESENAPAMKMKDKKGMDMSGK